ncbi:Hypothetical predicted protein [Olea europaea subsp. europaea]|uniref:Uncharacterized protein n=1 Tax=Olea europaea subsp. europaea TaxID=158383 RepID=A0A8S0TUV7_OLEEU|nr:Hypothetical predicted protein [Olea europaea subsp. europaea]
MLHTRRLCKSAQCSSFSVGTGLVGTSVAFYFVFYDTNMLEHLARNKPHHKTRGHKIVAPIAHAGDQVSSKSKDFDTAKISGHSKLDTQKTPNSNGKGKTKSSLPKSKETYGMKEKATDFGKTSEIKKGKLQDKSEPPESEAKNGKKRRRS